MLCYIIMMKINKVNLKKLNVILRLYFFNEYQYYTEMIVIIY